MHKMCGTCVYGKQGVKGEKQKPGTKTTERGQHEAVKAAQRPPVSRAARMEEGDINFRDTILVCHDFSLFF